MRTAILRGFAVRTADPTGSGPLAPVLRGEGWGEGRFRVHKIPLTLALSPTYRGEGTRENHARPAPCFIGQVQSEINFADEFRAD